MTTIERNVIGCVVEGKAEVESMPVLLRRLIVSIAGPQVSVAKPFRIPRTRMVRPEHLEKAMRQLVSDRANIGGIVVLADADDDCPAELGPRLLKQAQGFAGSIPVRVILANRELEAWFLGAWESIAKDLGLDVREVPTSPEGIRDCKSRLGVAYDSVARQPALAATFDMEQARRRCPSFDKLWRDVESLIREIGGE